jgi:hypothetical protein
MLKVGKELRKQKGLATLQIIRLGRKWIIHDHARMLIMSLLTDSLTH